jgi:hypothetical protein
METIFSITNTMRWNPGVSDGQLLKLSSSLPYPLPKDFISFLKFSNGAMGMIGLNYLEIVKAEELISFNQDYSVESDAPGLSIFGTDGGGEAYALITEGKILWLWKFLSSAWNGVWPLEKVIISWTFYKI